MGYWDIGMQGFIFSQRWIYMASFKLIDYYYAMIKLMKLCRVLIELV